ncbi:MAG: ATP-binding protein [Patescibacteria group bacterium]|nr:ATP-binding protein [Patescibacteria group bacterium]MDD5164546.1 ATP-binding protein [Patescibacteria group bacterium]MDD5534712.1 ATP-binding protein [Patescibacteria group bacterium]
MKRVKEVSHQQLRNNINPRSLPDLKDLTPLLPFLGQPEAKESIKFGINIPGHIFVTRQHNSGGVTSTLESCKKTSQEQSKSYHPQDLVYLYNFDDEANPILIILSQGEGNKLQGKMMSLSDALIEKISALLREEAHLAKKHIIAKGPNERIEGLKKDLENKCLKLGFALIPSKNGYGFEVLPISKKNPNTIMSGDEMDQLKDKERKELVIKREELINAVNEMIRKMRETLKEGEAKIMEFEESEIKKIVNNLFSPLLEDCLNPIIQKYLTGLQDFTLTHIDFFMPPSNGNEIPKGTEVKFSTENEGYLPEFQINVLVDSSDQKCPPVIVEKHPTYLNLFGQIHLQKVEGELITDHMLIKPGSLIKANGGYLIIKMDDLDGVIWKKLKKCLEYNMVKIEDVGEYIGYEKRIELNPDSVPINVKVIIIGEPEIYNLLVEYDHDFTRIFNIKAEFSSTMTLNPENLKGYAQFVADYSQKNNLLSFEKSAIAKIIEYGSREVEDQKKLSTKFGQIGNLMIEANYWAKDMGNKTVQDIHIKMAIEKKRRRCNLKERRYQEMIEKNIFFVDTRGLKTGEINFLEICTSGDYEFGIPGKFTATISIGEGGVINIDREVGLTGPIFDKAVLILSGYMNGTFAKKIPFCLKASLCSEQNYGEIEGDSATLAETAALISAISRVPIKQSLAITGSMNQKGKAQPIGGANTKIEGFFDVCHKRGLTGSQGVIIPNANLKDLMLREDIVEAVKNKKFHIYAVKTIDEAIEILTGKEIKEVHKKILRVMKEMYNSIKEDTPQLLWGKKKKN